MNNNVYWDRLIFVWPPFPKSNKICNSFHVTNTNELFCTCKETFLLSFHLPSSAPTSILGFYMTSRRSCAPIRVCLHYTGATFAPGRVHSGSLSWLYICLHDTTTKCYAGASHPGVSSPRFSHRGENFTPVRNLATVSCKRETSTHFGVKSVCR